MKIQRYLPTITLITVFSMIYLFGFIYYLNLSAGVYSNVAIKDGLSAVGSFFGGIATLITAYVASILFNDWKVQQKHQNALGLAKLALESYAKMEFKIDEFLDECEIEYQKEIYIEHQNQIHKAQAHEPTYEYHSLLKLAKEVERAFYEFHHYYLMYLYVNYPQDNNNKLILPMEITPSLEKLESEIHTIVDLTKNLIFSNNKKKILKKIMNSSLDDNLVDFLTPIKKTILNTVKLEK